jgi:hypothetical protein
MSLTLSDVLEAIANGDLDGEATAKAIVSAINARSRFVSQTAGAAVMATLKAGDRVTVSDKVRPQHFAGRQGTVQHFNRSKVSVLLDGDPVATRIPPSLLTKVEA